MSTNHEIWLVTGSQHLYGEDALKQVSADSQAIAKQIDSQAQLPVKLVFKPIVTTADEIRERCLEANGNDRCVGLAFWMHTFSPAKMWISGLKVLNKPYCHLHTQFGREIPWADIDMDFMNLHQSAHGDREFGFICSRLRQERTVIVGHWEAPDTQQRLCTWAHAALAWNESRNLRVVRFGDNMRQVAVTEGDKVEAESTFGFSVNTHGIGDLVEVIQQVSEPEIKNLCDEYATSYSLAPELLPDGKQHQSLKSAAAIELGLRAFLDQGQFKAFTDTFEDLHGLPQLPGLPVQRLMADGYGFGAEGDWKHAALVRIMKMMAGKNDQGTSFMEDYTYHLEAGKNSCLGAHMLEICPSIASGKPSCEIHPLGIGGKDDPVRLVFDGKPGRAINVSLVDMGNRFRLIVAELEAIAAPEPLPNLPVARVLWNVLPDFNTGIAAWIQAGGAHHTGFSYTVTTEQIEDFATMSGVELVVIDQETRLRDFKNQLRWNDAAFGIRGL